MDIVIRAAQLAAQEVAFGGIISLQEVRIAASGLTARDVPAGPILISEMNATLVISEVALNRFLAGRVEGVRDLEVAMLTGRVRVSGRVVVGPIAIPFALTAVPEIEGGARLRLDPRQMGLVGAPLPGFSAQVIGDRINGNLAEAFDATRLPFAIRLTGLTVETGRIVLTATASVEVRPSEKRVARADADTPRPS
jgi:hypothetical protein